VRRSRGTVLVLEKASPNVAKLCHAITFAARSLLYPPTPAAMPPSSSSFAHASMVLSTADGSAAAGHSRSKLSSSIVQGFHVSAASHSGSSRERDGTTESSSHHSSIAAAVSLPTVDDVVALRDALRVWYPIALPDAKTTTANLLRCGVERLNGSC
jgi:hypothetical protein